MLYFSGYIDNAVIRNRLETDNRSFLPKPFVPEALLRKVREILASP